MPIYEYKCKKCSHKFERLVFGKEEKIKCPQCGGKVEKLFSTFSTKSSSFNIEDSEGKSCDLNCPTCNQ